MNKKGIDVSKWQGEINWNEVKADGTDFAMIRAGYGREVSQVDKCFHQNVKGAKEAGIPVGVYWYSYALSAEEAKKEAKACLEVIKGYKFEYPVVFDIEDKSQLKLTNRQRTDIVKAFCSEIEKAGYYAMFYCNPNWLNNYLIKDELKKYDLWLAQWNVAAPSVECGIWQKSEEGTVSGIKGNVDLNESFKNYPEIIKIKGLNGFKQISSGEYKKPVEEKPKYLDHIVDVGENLSNLAVRYGTTVDELVKLNNISNPNRIYQGQLLKVPNGKPKKTAVWHTVEKGDTLWDLAERYYGDGRKYTAIRSINELKTDNIYPGQKLLIKK